MSPLVLMTLLMPVVKCFLSVSLSIHSLTVRLVKLRRRSPYVRLYLRGTDPLKYTGAVRDGSILINVSNTADCRCERSAIDYSLSDIKWGVTIEVVTLGTKSTKRQDFSKVILAHVFLAFFKKARMRCLREKLSYCTELDYVTKYGLGCRSSLRYAPFYDIK